MKSLFLIIVEKNKSYKKKYDATILKGVFCEIIHYNIDFILTYCLGFNNPNDTAC